MEFLVPGFGLTQHGCGYHCESKPAYERPAGSFFFSASFPPFLCRWMYVCVPFPLNCPTLQINLQKKMELVLGVLEFSNQLKFKTTGPSSMA